MGNGTSGGGAGHLPNAAALKKATMVKLDDVELREMQKTFKKLSKGKVSMNVFTIYLIIWSIFLFV